MMLQCWQEKISSSLQSKYTKRKRLLLFPFANILFCAAVFALHVTLGCILYWVLFYSMFLQVLGYYCSIPIYFSNVALQNNWVLFYSICFTGIGMYIVPYLQLF